MVAATHPAHSAQSHRPFTVGAVLATGATLLFVFWLLFNWGGAHVTLEVDDIGEGIAAWCATAVCTMAALRAPSGRATWGLFAMSSFAWGAGEAVWCYYALIKNVSVPFPSLADVGFLIAVPFAFAGLLVYPAGAHRRITRMKEVFDGCIIAASLLFASWAMLLGPLYRSHQGSVLQQVVSLTYPISDVVMVSLVVILIARAGSTGRIRLQLLMAGVVAFAVSDSAFSYLTEVNNYNNSNLLDTGWVAGYLLIALGALWTLTSPAPEEALDRESTISVTAPYVPVLIVLVAISVELMRGHRIGTVTWFMAVALAVLVLGRELLRLAERLGHNDLDSLFSDPGREPPSDQSADAALVPR